MLLLDGGTCAAAAGAAAVGVAEQYGQLASRMNELGSLVKRQGHLIQAAWGASGGPAHGWGTQTARGRVQTLCCVHSGLYYILIYLH